MDISPIDEQLDALRTQLLRCRNGLGGTVFIEGSVATGKTALLDAFKREAAAEGAVILGATAAETERFLPLAIFGQLFHDPLITPLDIQAKLWDENVASAVCDENTELIPGWVISLLETLRNILIGLSRGKCVLVCVDDIHRAHPLSLRCLSYLIRRVASLQILTVLTGVGSSISRSRLLDDVIRQPHCRVVRIGPLALREVSKVIADQAGPAAARRLSVECFRVTGGNPLLLNGLLADTLAPGGERLAELRYGANFRESARSYASRLSPAEVTVASAVAVADVPADVGLVAEILQLPGEEVGVHLETLYGSGVLRHGRICHETLRAVFLDFIPRESREHLNLRVARIIHERNWPAVTVARHLVGVGSGVGEWAVPVLREAASRAMEENVTLAIQYLRAAAEISRDDAQSAELAVMLMRTEWGVNPTVAARHLPALERHIFSGRLGMHDAIVVVNHALWNGQVKRAKRIIDHLGKEVEILTHDEARHVSEISHYLRYYYPELELPWESPGAAPTRETDPLGRSDHHETALLLGGGIDRWADEDITAMSYRILQRTPLTVETITSILVAIAALVFSDNLAVAATLCDERMREMMDGAPPARLALFSAVRSVISYRQGDLNGAEEHAARALDVMSTQSWGTAIGLPVAAMVQAKIAKNDLDAAASFLRIPVPETRFYTPIGLLYWEARGVFYRVTGRPLSAIADFRRCGALMVKWGMDFAPFLPWRAELAQACLELGRVDEARRLADELAAAAAPGATRARGTGLRLQAALSDRASRPFILLEAIRCLSDCGDELSTALALGEAARAWTEVSKKTQAHSAARQAARLARKCGAERLDHLQFPWPGDGIERLREPESGLRPPAAPALSAAERRVAELACDHTNSQIASQLHITVSTVEQHLTRVYRKLGIARRGELRHGLHAS